jgi:hypothetical protein
MFLITGIFFIISCETAEDIEEYPNPTISLKSENGYCSNDTSLLINDSVKIGIIAETQSLDALTHFNKTIILDTQITTIDSGFYSNTFEYEKILTKGIADIETWSFYVKDRNGRKSDIISINLYKDSASIFGEIAQIPSIVFGAQNNNNYGSFYSLLDQQIYTQSLAFENQSLINLLYFYDLIEADANTISSPGANIDDSVFPGQTGLANWTENNTTRFILFENILVEEFDKCQNDSLILANSFEFDSGKRKAKNLASDDIYSFVTEDGKNGLFKVIEVIGLEEGEIEISIKMQKL